jgi:hypothetical protein
MCRYFWVAVNQLPGVSASVTLSPMPSVHVSCSPIPSQLFGFQDLEEARAAHDLLLNGTIEQMERAYEGWRPRIESGDMAYIQPDDPEPPRGGVMVWNLDPPQPLEPIADGQHRHGSGTSGAYC